MSPPPASLPEKAHPHALKHSCGHLEPVLRANSIRHPGRLRAPRRRLPVDRVGDLGCRADGQRDERGGRRQGRRDHGVPRRPEGCSTSRPTTRSHAGIPVFSYNADSPPPNKRLAYIGQDLYLSGQMMGDASSSWSGRARSRSLSRRRASSTCSRASTGRWTRSRNRAPRSRRR